jgi:hypothetical protein
MIREDRSATGVGERGHRPMGRPEPSYITQARGASGLNYLLGLWMVLSPWVLDFSSADDAVWNATVVGGSIALLAVIRMLSPLRLPELSWVNLILGVWLALSPWTISYEELQGTTALTINNLVVGCIVAVLALWSATGTRIAAGRKTATDPRPRS